MKIICKQCKTEFNIYPARVLKQNKGKYCSKICYTESMKLGIKKKPRKDVLKDHHNKKRFGGNKFKAMERDEYKCRNCGIDKNLEIHHIDGTGYKSIGDPKKSNNSLENLMTLCHSCHIRITNRNRGFKTNSLKI